MINTITCMSFYLFIDRSRRIFFTFKKQSNQLRDLVYKEKDKK